MAEEQNCHDGPELCRSEPVETRLQIQVIINGMSISREQKKIFLQIEILF